MKQLIKVFYENFLLGWHRQIDNCPFCKAFYHCLYFTSKPLAVSEKNKTCCSHLNSLTLFLVAKFSPGKCLFRKFEIVTWFFRVQSLPKVSKILFFERVQKLSGHQSCHFWSHFLCWAKFLSDWTSPISCMSIFRRAESAAKIRQLIWIEQYHSVSGCPLSTVWLTQTVILFVIVR